MTFDRLRGRIAVSFVAAIVCVPVGPAHAAGVDFVGAVEATHPLAYYRLGTPVGKSLVGPTTYRAIGGVTGGGPGAPIGMADNRSAQFNGRDGYLITSQAGGVGETASMMAWVNLAELPSKTGHFFYVEGESQNGNDLDLQFETDDVLRFYTASGGNLAYKPPPATLVGQWHLIVATLDTATHARVVYWDGKQVAADKGGGRAGKTSLFSIGASTVFSGRFFHGGIEEAALWNRALTAVEVAAIYATAKPTPSSGTAAASSSAAGGATGGPTTNAKVELVDATGPLTLKDPEKIAFMFVSAMEQIEQECFRAGNHVCTINEMVAGPVVKGQHIAGLKFDPKTDPNYTYTLNDPQNGEWAINADPKKPGLIDFCLSAHNYFVTTVTYSRKGKATPTDTGFTSTGITGDSFRTQ